MPKVSVIVPIYNVEKYLEKCINSLLSQTLEDIQIILVNDGSKDNSGNIAKEYEKNNKDRVIYVEKENGGLSDARNYGLKYATGDFIAFLDSDDYIEKNAYEEMYNKVIEENADYVECDFIWEFPNKIRVDKQYPYKNKKEMLSFVRVVAWNKLIKRQLITDNNLEFPKGLRYEDVEFTYVEAASRVEYLQSAKVDVILANFTVTDERAEKVDFALPYMKVALGVVSPDDALITDVKDLEGKKLIVVKGTTAETYFTDNYPDIELVKYDEYQEAYDALLDGRGDAFSTDNTEVLAWANQFTVMTSIRKTLLLKAAL